jgi:uncharacterized protein YndB with AHSA1/START domain
MNARAEPVAAEKYALEITRVFDAPPILVFKAFTKPEHMVRWWGPKNFTTTVQKLEFREGGSYRFTIHGPDNTHRMSGVFREIVEPNKIMFTFAWDDENGEPGKESLITITIEPEGAKARLTFQQAPFDNAETRDSHAEGWGEVLDKLAPFLSDFRG